MRALDLLVLARDNKADGIRAAVASGVPVDISNDFGQSSLHIAVLWGNLEAARALLELGANVNICNSRGSTPLHFAACAKRNAREVCELLLEADADPDAVDMQGAVPYEKADDDEIRKLLGGPDARIFELAAAGKADELKALLRSGEIKSVRVNDPDGQPPLHNAILAESLETVKVILDHDAATVNYPSMEGDTPLHVAASVGNLDILRTLLSHKPELNVQNMHTSEYAMGNWMLHGETIMPYDKSPLHVAVESGDVEATVLLLEAGVDVNLLDFNKCSALHIALESNDTELVELLIEKGADVNQPNLDFTTCLHLTAHRGAKQLMQALLSKGADVSATNADGWTPLHLAARAGHTDKVALLLGAQASPAAKNAQGNTPLHLACINGHQAAAVALLQGGAALDAVNNDGKTPLDVCKTPELATALQA